MSDTDAIWQKIRIQKEEAARRKAKLEATRQKREEAQTRLAKLAQSCNIPNRKRRMEEEEKVSDQVSDYDRASRQVSAEVRKLLNDEK